MDRSLVGRPREAIGMSNDVKIGNRAPTFQEAMFAYDGKAATVAVTPLKP